MGLFKSLFTRPLDALNPPPTVEIPAQLPNVTAATADEIVLACKPEGLAEEAFNPEQTPSEYLSALQEKHLGDDMIKTLAHAMPDREGAGWAAKSAETVSDKLPPKDLAALRAAQAWLEDPNEATRAAAGKAASKAGLRGPGAWAAQAVAWGAALAAEDDNSASPTKKPRLAPQAVAAAVMMSAAIASNPDVAPKEDEALQATSSTPGSAAENLAAADAVPTDRPSPEDLAKGRRAMFRTQQPFIAQGMAIASGRTRV